MEYIDAPPMDSGVVGKWEEKHRSDLVCYVLCRSAVILMHLTDEKS